MTALDRTLATALKNGRVTALTAPIRSIARAIQLGYLAEAELAGTYELTFWGRCAAGDPPF